MALRGKSCLPKETFYASPKFLENLLGIFYVFLAYSKKILSSNFLFPLKVRILLVSMDTQISYEEKVYDMEGMNGKIPSLSKTVR